MERMIKGWQNFVADYTLGVAIAVYMTAIARRHRALDE